MTNPTQTKDRPRLSAPTWEMLEQFWAELNADYPTEADCYVALTTPPEDAGVITCPNCRSDQVERDADGRVVHCSACKQSRSLTAGTFFHGIRDPRAWLAAILLKERGMAPSINQFHLLADVAYDTAWNIYKKLGMVIESHLPNNTEVVPSALFSTVISKRSRETPAREHPTAEIFATESRYKDETSDSSTFEGPPSEAPKDQQATPSDSAKDVTAVSNNTGVVAPAGSSEQDDELASMGNEQEVYDLISQDPVHFDWLMQRTGMAVGALSGVLAMLEIKQLARILPGDWYIRTTEKKDADSPDDASKQVELNCSSEAIQRAQDAVAYFEEINQGLSRKYLQLFIAAFWCCLDKVRWPRDSLRSACLQCDRIRNDQVRAYVSPAFVQVVV